MRYLPGVFVSLSTCCGAMSKEECPRAIRFSKREKEKMFDEGSAAQVSCEENAYRQTSLFSPASRCRVQHGSQEIYLSKFIGLGVVSNRSRKRRLGLLSPATRQRHRPKVVADVRRCGGGIDHFLAVSLFSFSSFLSSESPVKRGLSNC